MQEGIEKIEWRDVLSFEGYYMVSRCGLIKRLARPDSTIPQLRKEKILYAEPGYYDNYCFVGLRRDGRQKTYPVHRIVASAFLPNPENKRCVNHKDRVKSNNHADNLEWATHKENSQHMAMMDRLHLSKMEVGKKVRIIGTNHIGEIIKVEGNWIHIDPSPDKDDTIGWPYKYLSVIN